MKRGGVDFLLKSFIWCGSVDWRFPRDFGPLVIEFV